MSITNDLVIVETEDRTVRDPEKVYDGSTVPKKYRGTAADQHDMIVLWVVHYPSFEPPN